MDKFRVYLHSAALCFIAIGILLEIGVVVFANRIQNLYDDESSDEGEEAKDHKAEVDENGKTKEIAQNGEMELKPIENGENSHKE